MKRDWYDIKIKIVDFTLDTAKVIHNPSLGRTDYTYEKVKLTPGDLKLVYNIDFYCSVETAEKITASVNSFLLSPVTAQTLKEIEYHLNNVVRKLYFDEDIWLSSQKEIKEGMVIFQADSNFELY